MFGAGCAETCNDNCNSCHHINGCNNDCNPGYKDEECTAGEWSITPIRTSLHLYCSSTLIDWLVIDSKRWKLNHILQINEMNCIRFALVVWIES